MGIFKKTSESDRLLKSKEDIKKAIKALSIEEQNSLYEDLIADLEKEEEENGAYTAEETSKDDLYSKSKSESARQIDQATEDIAKTGAGSQAEKDRIDDSVGEQEHLEGNDDRQSAKNRVDDSLGESEAERVEKEDREEVNSALGARISALEEQIANLSERMEQMLTNLENKDFGAHHGGGAEKPATEDDDAYIDAYYAKQARRK